MPRESAEHAFGPHSGAVHDLVIRNARISTASDVFDADIAITGGRVVCLGQALGPGRSEIDAAGRTVTPGGVDAHCHMDQPLAPPARMADDFETGSRSAACGGTTTIIPFAAQQKGQSLKAAVEDYHRRAGALSCIDYAFHMIVTDPTPEVLERELPDLIARGYTSFKIYMTYDDLKLDDAQILDVLDIARRHGAMPMIHAENADCIRWLTRRLKARGHVAPRYHGDSRPPLVEREAAHRAISLAELVDVQLLIVHVSGAEAISQIQAARARGLNIHAETCPQYLFLTADDLGGDSGYDGARCVCSPPPRDPENQKSVWRGLENGLFSVFSSDHAPFRYDDPAGKKPGGREVDFDHIPNGIPGLETRLPLLYSEGVLTGRIPVTRFVELTASNPAKLYGLYPRKGTIAIGSDADLVIWDERPVTVTNADLHHAVDYTPYEGMRLNAWPALTLSRGEIVWDGTNFVGRQGHGAFIARRCPYRGASEDEHTSSTVKLLA